MIRTVLLLFTSLCFAQHQQKALEKTLYDYINGSSYNNIAQLESAFTDNATLYLTLKDGYQRLTPKKYTGFFENGTSGTFNGRIGSILSTDIEGDIATAKVEILIPKLKWRFIDLFLLKNTADGWKIISKTATKMEKAKERGDRILFITSNTHYYGKTDIANGNSFSEIAYAYEEFTREGYGVDFVSPKGGQIPLRYINTSEKIQKNQLYNPDLLYALKHTKKPKQIDASKYSAVYFVGGGGVMFDIPFNKEIHKIAMDVYEKYNGIISSVCHGTAGIVNLKTQDGEYLIKGKRVNGYPDQYERKDREFYKTFPFYITQTVEKHGGIFKFSKRNTPHVEVDGRLVTGQNYLSSTPVAQKIIALLKDKK